MVSLACPIPGSADSRSTGDPQTVLFEGPHFMRGAFSLGLTSVNSEITSSRSRGSHRREGRHHRLTTSPTRVGSPLEHLTPNEGSWVQIPSAPVVAALPQTITRSTCPPPSVKPARRRAVPRYRQTAALWGCRGETSGKSPCRGQSQPSCSPRLPALWARSACRTSHPRSF